MSGNGSGRRPQLVSYDELEKAWEAIFKKCKICGQPLGDKDHIHTCSPQKGSEDVPKPK